MSRCLRSELSPLLLLRPSLWSRSSRRSLVPPRSSRRLCSRSLSRTDSSSRLLNNWCRYQIRSARTKVQVQQEMRKPKWFTFFAFHLFLPDAVLFSPPCAFFASLRLSLPVEAGCQGLLLERSIIRTPQAIPKNAFSVTRHLSEWNLNSQHFLLWIRVKYISYPHCLDRRGKLRLHQTSWRCFNEAGVKGRLKDGVFPTNCPLQLFWKKFASTSAKEDNLKLHVHIVTCIAKCSLDSSAWPALRKIWIRSMRNVEILPLVARDSKFGWRIGNYAHS